ncbi:MAG: AmmeMemoRadiSam system protein B [Patescibacteria group bacterium]|jgi:AmmeMemoRadiSam system protein B
MIVFAAFVPHPPLLIPEIGKESLKEVKPTEEAMLELSKRFEENDIDSVLIISPHGNLNPYAMTIGMAPRFSGNFGEFNAPEISMSFPGNIELSNNILNGARKEKVPAETQNHDDGYYVLDHGVMVPLYFLTKDSAKIEIVTIGYSMLDRAAHYSFGEIIGKICEKDERRIAIIASGDLSHKHQNNFGGIDGAPEKFDNLVRNSLQKFDPEKIIYADEDMQEAAGECGYRSLLIALGAIAQKKIEPEVLSYEHPFGVGYLVVDFQVSE